MRRLSCSLALVALAALPAVSRAQTITFEGTTSGPIANGYAGLNWSNFGTDDGTAWPGSGYEYGKVSGDMVAYNAHGTPASLLQGATPFTLTSGYFTAAWNNGLVLDVTGYVGGVATFFQSAILSRTGPQLLTFDWDNLDQVVFASSGGVAEPYYEYAGTHFVLDNLTVGMSVTATPEPTSLVLLGSGLVGVLGIARRRRTAA